MPSAIRTPPAPWMSVIPSGPKAVAIVRSAGIDLHPTWLPFTPWTTPAGVADIASFIWRHDLAPVTDPNVKAGMAALYAFAVYASTLAATAFIGWSLEFKYMLTVKLLPALLTADSGKKYRVAADTAVAAENAAIAKMAPKAVFQTDQRGAIFW